MYPLDVVKTRMQLATGTKSLGLVGSFKSIIAEEGYMFHMPVCSARLIRVSMQSRTALPRYIHSFRQAEPDQMNPFGLYFQYINQDWAHRYCSKHRRGL